MLKSLTTFPQTDEYRIDVTVSLIKPIKGAKVGGNLVGKYWVQGAAVRNVDNVADFALPVQDDQGKIMTFDDPHDALEAAIKYFGL